MVVVVEVMMVEVGKVVVMMVVAEIVI